METLRAQWHRSRVPYSDRAVVFNYPLGDEDHDAFTGDVLIVPRTGERIRVTSVRHYTISVARGQDGTTAAPIRIGDYLLVQDEV